MMNLLVDLIEKISSYRSTWAACLRDLMNVFIVRGLLAGCMLSMFGGHLSAESNSFPIQVNAQLWTSPASSLTNPPGTMSGEATAVTMLPHTKLPQYEIESVHRQPLKPTQRTTGTLQWILQLPDKQLVVETKLLIDGQPFCQAREDLIRSILEADDESPNEDTVATDKDRTPPEESSDDSAEDGASATRPPAFRPASTPRDLLFRYASATGVAIDDLAMSDAHWVIRKLLLGPELLQVKPLYQSFRADRRPFFNVLDQDRNGMLSPTEIQSCEASLAQCDTNLDDIVDILEIEQAADDPLRKPGKVVSSGQALLSLIDKTEQPVMIRFEVNFDRHDATQSTLQLVSVESSPKSPWRAKENRIIGRIDQSPIAVVAIQRKADASGGASARDTDQISVGAVIDGFPLLSAVDPNTDGRITIRERRGCQQRLARLDQNKDGEITSDEARPTLRICFALGPIAHLELANVGSLTPSVSTETPIAAPDWFLRMDANQDGDLSRREFPGTDEQFRQLDLDDDQLISTTEAGKAP